ncbi:GTPase-associated protein 1-related protein [Amycolatopsis sp. GM8]|uniref:GTPase-associated protein 1-related protein n=1 Tax=Amycolatopsis sp. GM8 TaxID=2896530 RepID=UPI001F2F783C|nr:GTPase-associated protein 1-related protein [Amycolatopsis sp. GM8]
MAAPRAFASLYYTDCLPGQGLRGVAGFQFQAVSPGVEHRVMSLVQESVLYEPPPEWMRRRRPVRDYPPSLSHVFDGAYVTAQGVYLGTEANGSREGNQFTHAISTTEPSAYGQLRPAQLWAASWWARRPAATTTCEPIDGEPDPGPLRTEVVHAWLAGRPDAEEMLTAIVSALHGLEGDRPRRLAFVADDPETVLRWLTAGTLLLPQHSALEVSFRIFASNISYSRHAVLAVHPDWAGSVHEHGFAVFDLITGSHPPIEPSPAARFWVPRFLRGDPVDVVDAVELADRFAGSSETPGDRLAAGVLVLGDDVRADEDVHTLAAWLARQPARVVAEVGQEIAAAVLAARPDATALHDLHRALSGRSGPLTDRLRRELRAAELNALSAIDDPAERAAFVAGLPPVSAATTTETGEATELFEAALAQARPEHVDALLLLAARHLVPVRPAGFAENAGRFAQWWSSRPEQPLHPQGWGRRAEMLDLLKDALAARLSDPRTVAQLRTHWWRLLWPTVTDATGGIDAELAAAAVAAGDQARHDMIVHAAAHVQGSDGDVAAWQALFRLTPSVQGELRTFIEALPHGHTASDALADLALRAGGATRGRPTAYLLDLLRLLAYRNWRPTQGPPALWSVQDELLARWLSAVQYPEQISPPTRHEMNAVGDHIIAARAGEIVQTLNSGAALSGGTRVHDGGWALHRFLVDYLSRTLHEKHPPPGVNTEILGALALDLSWSGRLAPSETERLDPILQRWTSRLDYEARQRVGKHLVRLDRANGEVWRNWLKKYRGWQGRRRSRRQE